MKKFWMTVFLLVPLACSQDMDLGTDAQLQKDIAAIDTYLATNNITATKDPSGLRYRINSLGASTVKPTATSSIKVNYTGTIMSSGVVFDKSIAPVTFQLSSLIEAWRIAMPLFTKGTSVTLYVPSTLGYGTKGSGSTIPPNTNLVFDIELLDVL